jgi:hypothetical protein
VSHALGTEQETGRTGGVVFSAPRHFPIQPFHLLYPVAALASIVLSQGPVRDPDVYWHVRLGGEMLRTHSVAGHAAAWSLVPSHGHWVSSEWLAEIVLHGFVSAFGWRGMLVYQALTAVALLGALAYGLRPRGDARTNALVYALVAISLAPLFQARPQTLSLLFVVWLGVVCRDVLVHRRLPHVVVFVAATWLWAQLHGLWLLAPLMLVVAAVGRLLDRRSRDELRFARRAGTFAVVAIVVGCVNPVGPQSLLLPFTLHSATRTINEWQPTNFVTYFTWGLLGLVGLLVYAWARTTERAPRAELFWTGALLAFGMLAFRNVPVATLLLAPIAAHRLARPRSLQNTTHTERRILLSAGVALGMVAVLVAALGAVSGRPIPSGSPTRLAAALDDGRPHRVLDAYNTGGIVLAFAGPRVRVGIDGRADYYGSHYIDRYSDMIAMRAGWQRLFNQLNPDAAIVVASGPLVAWLSQHGWNVTQHQGQYVLLLKNGSTAG